MDINRIDKTVQNKKISLSPVQLDCRLSILDTYLERASSLQLDIEDIESEWSSRSELED